MHFVLVLCFLLHVSNEPELLLAFPFYSEQDKKWHKRNQKVNFVWSAQAPTGLAGIGQAMNPNLSAAQSCPLSCTSLSS